MQGHYSAFSGPYGFPMFNPYPSSMMYPVNFQGQNMIPSIRPSSTSISRVPSASMTKSASAEAKPTSFTSPPSLERSNKPLGSNKPTNKIPTNNQQGKNTPQEGTAGSIPAQQRASCSSTSMTPSNLSASSTPNVTAGPVSKVAKTTQGRKILQNNSDTNSSVAEPDCQRFDEAPSADRDAENVMIQKSANVQDNIQQCKTEFGKNVQSNESSHTMQDITIQDTVPQSCFVKATMHSVAERTETDHLVKTSDDCVVPLRARQSDDSTDQEGHFQVELGKLIDQSAAFPQGRYRVIQLLGSGTYGKVLLCADQKYRNASVAVKVIRKHDQTMGPELYRAAAKNEIQILRDLGGKHGTVLLLRDFEHSMHICMTFEVLGDNLQEAMKYCGGVFNINQVRNVSHQILNAISYVHSKNIIHTDLKPENILLLPTMSKSQPMLIKIVDFGTAIYSDAWHPPIVGTMHYRAPEAVLQSGYSFSLDIWAIGCIIAELYTGHKLFELVHADVHLVLMEKCLGPIPAELIYAGWSNPQQQNRNLFQLTSNGTVHLAPSRKDHYSQHAIQSMKPLHKAIDDPDLRDLLIRMLRHDPAKRLSGSEGLKHVFYEVSEAEDEDDHLLESSDGAQLSWTSFPSVVSWYARRC